MSDIGLVQDYQSSVLSDRETENMSGRPDTVSVAVDEGEADLIKLADASMPKICKMLETGVRARQKRFEEIRKNEDMYNGNTPPALKGRSNIPMDCIIMRGFIDTLRANIDEPIDLTYGETRERGRKAAKRMTAVFKEETGPNKGNWDMYIQDSKFLAALSGRGFAKLVCSNDPKFKLDFYIPDHYDMVTEPQGGAYLNKHLFKFEMNIFRDKADMLSAGRSGYYNMKQVSKLVARYADDDFKKNDDIYRNKLARFATFGVDIEAESYVGQSLYRLTEGAVSINHKWYYILFSYETQTWVRFRPLEEVCPWAKIVDGMGPWVSWATHRHPFVFWTNGPADDIRPIAYTAKKVINLTVDNLEKRNWDMKAYDPRIFTDPSKLLYRPDGIARATLKNGQKLSDGILSMQTPDTTNITVNLMQFLDSYLGRKIGISDDSQGDSNEQVLGIQVNNLQQVSKRMTLFNKQYAQMYNDLGMMFDYAVYEYLREDYAVKLVGLDGADWDEVFTRDDANEEFTIEVKAGADSQKHDVLTANKRAAFYDSLEANPNLAPKINPEVYIRVKGRDAGVDDEAIDRLLDVKNAADEDIIADAATAIEDCIAGRPYKLYRDANVTFIDKIMTFVNKHYVVIPTDQLRKMSTSAQKEYNSDMKEYDRLMALIKAHMPFVQENAKRQLAMMQVASGAGAPVAPTRLNPQAMAELGIKNGGMTPTPAAGSGPVAPTPPAPVGTTIGQ